MIWFVLFTVAVFAVGFLLGAWLGWPEIPRRKPRRVAPKTTVPIANVIQLADWRYLNVPAVKRRRR